MNYTYDGDGLRVEKSSGTLYWRSYSGQVLEETDTSGNMQRDYVFPDRSGFRRRARTPAKHLNFGGGRIAWRDSSGNVYYYFADAIGSTRAATDASGNTCFEADYYPYGQENDYNTSCSPTYKFTGYEFDSETGNYYAYARYYDPRLGRFLSADPLGGAISNPQSLNRYGYVQNNPQSFVDPLGLFKQCYNESGNVVPCHDPPPVPDPELVGDCSGQWGLICQMFADEVASLVGYQPGPFAGATSTTTPKPRTQKCDATPQQEQQILQASKQFDSTPYAQQVCNQFVCNSINASGVLVGSVYVTTSTIFQSTLFRTVPSSGIQPGDVVVFSNPNPYHMGFVDSGEFPGEQVLSATVHGNNGLGGPRALPASDFPGTQTFFRLQVPCR